MVTILFLTRLFSLINGKCRVHVFGSPKHIKQVLTHRFFVCKTYVAPFLKL